MASDVVIVGGGIAGLACAVALCDSGFKVTLIEQSDALGGRARSFADSVTGDVVDIGPHILLTEYRNMLRLLDRLGTREQVIWQTDKLITLVERGRTVVMRSHRLPPPLHLLPSLLAVSSISLRDKLSNIRPTWEAMKITQADITSLDAIEAQDFLRHNGVSNRFIEWFWASVAMTILNVPITHCSTGSLLGFYRHLVGNNRVRIGFPRVALGALFVPGASRAIESAGGEIMFQRRVKRLRDRDGRVTGVVLDDEQSIEARFCVLALPPRELSELLPPEWLARHASFRDVGALQPSPYISSYIWFARKLTQEPFWTRAWSPTNLNYDSYDLSNIRAGWSDRPSVIASNIIYSHRAHDLADDEIIEATLRELAEFVPAAATTPVRHARVHRIPLGKLCPFSGIERGRPEPRTPIRGLFLAGDWIRSGLTDSMESAVRAAWLAAEQVCADAGKPRTLALPLPETAGLAALVRRFANRGDTREATDASHVDSLLP